MVTRGGGGFGEAGDIFPVVPPTRGPSGRGRRGATVLTPNQISKLLRQGPEQGGLTFIQALNEMKRYWESQGRTSSEAARIAEQQLGGGGVPTPPPVPGGPSVDAPATAPGAGAPGGTVADLIAENDATRFEGFEPFLAQEAEPQNVFRRFLIENAGFNQLNPFAQQGLSRQFGNQFQRFLINTLTGPVSQQEGGERFFDFLGSDPPDTGGLRSGLGRIADIFGGANIGPFARQAEIRDLFGAESDPNRSRALALSLTPTLAQTNPFLRGALERGTRSSLQSAIATDPELNPFTFFRERGFF